MDFFVHFNANYALYQHMVLSVLLLSTHLQVLIVFKEFNQGINAFFIEQNVFAICTPDKTLVVTLLKATLFNTLLRENSPKKSFCDVFCECASWLFIISSSKAKPIEKYYLVKKTPLYLIGLGLGNKNIFVRIPGNFNSSGTSKHVFHAIFLQFIGQNSWLGFHTTVQTFHYYFR